MTIRVAITGISGDVGLGAIRGLRDGPHTQNDFWLLGLDANDDFPGRHMVHAFAKLPFVAAPEYVDALVEQLSAHHIDILLPGIDSEIIVLSRARARLAQCKTRIALAPPELIEAADDKLATAAYVLAHGLKAPATCDADLPQDLRFPVVAKPRRGQASDGVFLLKDAVSLKAFLNQRRSGYCLQEYIEGPEITVGFLYDWNGVCKDAVAMERVLHCGRTTRAAVTKSPEILRFIDDFGTKIKGAGAINVQLRLPHHSGPHVFEINARLSGSTAMRIAVGFNDPLRIVNHLARGAPIERSIVQDATIYRVSTELVVRA